MQKPPSVSVSSLLRRPGGTYTDDGPDGAPPQDLDRIADAVPTVEPLHAGANEPYTVFGREYVPIKTITAYRRQGTASWYGRKFHGQRTAGGEVYDMYAMTAAHPTLPIPSYVRVTNLENRRSVVVRINDRGPFASGRIMDLSYAAAHRLGFAGSGAAQVELESILPSEPAAALAARPAPESAALPAATSAPSPSPAAAKTAIPPAAAVASSPLAGERTMREPESPIPVASGAGGIFLQLGAFSVQANADSFRARLASRIEGIGAPLMVLEHDKLFRVQLGPYADRARANTAARQIRELLELRPVVVVR